MSKPKAKSLYLVVKGRRPGLYTQWFGPGGAAEQVKDYNGAVYKGFYTAEAAAQGWVRSTGPPRLVCPPLYANCSKPLRRSRRKGMTRRFIALRQSRALHRWRRPHQPRPRRLWRRLAFRRPAPRAFRRLSPHHQQPHGAVRLHRRSERLERPGRLVVLFSDSSYVVNGIVKGWAVRGGSPAAGFSPIKKKPRTSTCGSGCWRSAPPARSNSAGSKVTPATPTTSAATSLPRARRPAQGPASRRELRVRPD